MTELIEKNQAALAELCRRFGVDRLYVFGSAASGNLRPSSDVDLVVSRADRHVQHPSQSTIVRLKGHLCHLFLLFSRATGSAGESVDGPS